MTGSLCRRRSARSTLRDLNEAAGAAADLQRGDSTEYPVPSCKSPLFVAGPSRAPFVLMADDELPDELEHEFDESDLHFAAQDGDMTRVRQLLADGRSPNAFDEISKTPLHYAAENGHIDVMRVLLEAGADVNAHEEARIGNTPLRDVADECIYGTLPDPPRTAKSTGFSPDWFAARRRRSVRHWSRFCAVCRGHPWILDALGRPTERKDVVHPETTFRSIQPLDQQMQTGVRETAGSVAIMLRSTNSLNR